jgi:glycosyltransferase involved in cell wall biosynthesis
MYIAHRGRKIVTVGTQEFKSAQFSVIVCPPELGHLTPREIIDNYEIWRGKVVLKSAVEDIPTKELKIAMIGSYGINCGIATYTKYLCDKMRPHVQELRIFSEFHDKTDPIEDQRANVLRCWDRRGNYSGIIPEMEAYDPDIIYIQHEYGCFNHGSNWNVLLGHLSRWRTIVVLHSVYDHMDKLIFEAPCKEIIVHSLGGRQMLHKKGINHCPIHYIPHGCLDPIDSQLRISQISNDHVLFQYGFGFEYKGWENAIQIVDRLREKYPNVLYIGVFNVSRFTEDFNNQYYDKLMGIIREKKLMNNVVLHKGFRSEEVLLSYLKQSRIGLFPYWNHPEWKVHGASGAIRLVLASGVPMVMGDVPFFEEFKGVVPVCSTIDEYVSEITKLFENYQYEQQIKKQIRDFISARTWDRIAQWYLSVRSKSEFTAIG